MSARRIKDDAPKNAIVKVQASPDAPPEGCSAEEVSLWRRFVRWFFPRLEKGVNLGEAYLTGGKALQEENEAERRLQEASELAAKVEVHRQEAVGKFIENIKEISKLPKAHQMVAFAKLLEQNPQAMKQLRDIEDLLDKLLIQGGLMISPFMGGDEGVAPTPRREEKQSSGPGSATPEEGRE